MRGLVSAAARLAGEGLLLVAPTAAVKAGCEAGLSLALIIEGGVLGLVCVRGAPPPP